ncbi:META domain-containing protein [Pleomorphovibrio marinus]|uniref:META domain-containing protein n=1 Tax=Pleomorphovibrio marinus TaxID=2164132 RepID=UPI000E0A6FDA|nr:META domain-containing protein [Pleomorphovibrio marinus]
MRIFNTLIVFLFIATLIFACGGEPLELSDHDWVVTDVTGSSASKDKLSNITLEFKEGQEVGGFAGCNEYRGGATYNREQIKFSTLYTDNEKCDDISLEERFLRNLENSATYTYSAGKLVFFDDSGNILVEMEKD